MTRWQDDAVAGWKVTLNDMVTRRSFAAALDMQTAAQTIVSHVQRIPDRNQRGQVAIDLASTLQHVAQRLLDLCGYCTRCGEPVDPAVDELLCPRCTADTIDDPDEGRDA